MYTQVQIKSYCNRNVIYAEAGVWVELISFSTPVYICELNGKRFPCHMDKLGKTIPGEQIVSSPDTETPQPKRRELLPDPSKIRRKLSMAEKMQLEYLENERLKRNSGNK